MLKIERKIIEIVEKYILFVGIALSCLFALYLRKIAVWWLYQDISSAFDMHPHHVETSLYYVVVSLTQYIPVLPVHAIKWLAAFSDFILSFLCVWLVKENVKTWDTKECIFFIACLFSPVVFIRGIVWGSLDSTAMVLLLLSYKLYKNKKILPALATAILAIGLCPCLLIVLVVYLLLTKEEHVFSYGLILLGGSVLILGICSLCLGESFVQGAETLYNWSSYFTVTGSKIIQVSEWIAQMIICFGLPLAVICVILAIKKKINYLWVFFTQVLVTVLYGSVLFMA